ncbi:DAK2 domain-containing protein [Nocardioides acrostichi]|uniref:DAK2 domain-containing protein n=1 Tax=Nocardioides acrostichi TaxID=2784339 RepID=A0A930UXW9_9ACTN|nr:DAK2 domain-containing protein [Nocardioides acrostichi]MBF4160424.1 DAK2 domain-containing protein [Nocardioides acrostichi]
MEPGSGRPRASVSLAAVLRFTDVAVDALARARAEVDGLNVYPVPDGDTGTNMYLTLVAARDALGAAIDEAGGVEVCEVGPALSALGRGGLLGARGNSGVILSEMLRAVARRLGRATPGERSALVMAEALERCSEAAYAAVGEPVEGTMLTVARAAADAAHECVDADSARTRDVLAAAAEAARAALARTPDQLAVLGEAGVVDAGGRGLTVILDAAEAAVTGRVPPTVPSRVGRRTPPASAPGASGTPAVGRAGHRLSAEGPSYEVMYLLEGTDEAVADLRPRLAALGDSLVVVGEEPLFNVHVHVDDVGAAIEAGIEAGRPHRIAVTHFADQVADQADQADQAAERAAQDSQPATRAGRCVVVVSAGPGLAALFGEAGATVVESGPGLRASTGEVLAAITACGAREVVVLPNDADSVRVAQAAASSASADHGIRVEVIPTQAQVQGLAALAVHDPARPFEADVREMTATARHARHGAVTVAARTAMTMAGPCTEGDALGVVAGDFAVVGDDLGDVAVDVLQRLIAGGGELVTVVSGADDADGALAARLVAWAGEHHPFVDVVTYDGGQQRYPLLLGVE